jgi:hypothetical protein
MKMEETENSQRGRKWEKTATAKEEQKGGGGGAGNIKLNIMALNIMVILFLLIFVFKDCAPIYFLSQLSEALTSLTCKCSKASSAL